MEEFHWLWIGCLALALLVALVEWIFAGRSRGPPHREDRHQWMMG